MKKIIVLLAICTATLTKAQNNVDGLVNAEKKFASYSVTHNMKDAFLHFLDSTGIVFEKGQPVNGIEAWSKRKAQAGILNWHPQFAEIAASGNLGYTTGPWTFQPKTINDSVVARGQYTTVWQLNKNGEWKFLVDLGVSNLPSTDSAEVIKIDAARTTTNPIDLLAMVKTEEAFIVAYKKNGPGAYRQFLAQQSILNRNSSLPATTSAEQSKIIEATPQDIRFAINGSGISKSGDLGFVYGTTRLNDKKENYLHIWRREKEGWKIAVEVLRY
jgi:ketosteroid isomerase-like protein